MRLTVLDGFRGFFLFFMMIIHMNMEFDAVIGKLNHHFFGWVEDAQGFVFISGLVVGLVYGKRLLRKGEKECRTALHKRMRTIYSHQAGLIVIFLVAALIIPGVMVQGNALRPYAQDPVWFTLASLLLVSGSLHMGILPMYLWFMFLTPITLFALHKGRIGLVIFLIVVAWLAAQVGIVDIADAAAEALLANAGINIPVGLFFNLLGWQVLYFSGLIAGYLMAADRLDLSFLKNPQWLTAFWVGVGMVVVLGILDRVVGNNLLGREFSQWFMTMQNRRDFTSLYLLAFALDLFLVVWLMTAGASCGIRILERVSAAMTWVFTRPALVFLGQHSLHVFSAHILIVYIVNQLMFGRSVGPLAANLIVGLSPLPLYLVAWLHKRSVDASAAGKPSTTVVTPAAKS